MLTFRQMLELEGCTRCGRCIPWCPTYAEGQREEIAPLEKIARLNRFLKSQYGGLLARLWGFRSPTQEEVERFSVGVYDCTLCGRCGQACPVKIETRSLWVAMRSQLVGVGCYPEPLDKMREAVLANRNILGEDNRNRTVWTQDAVEVSIGVGRREGVKVGYFVGCVSAFYPTAYAIPRGLVSIMQKARVGYTTLGGDEWCCGFPLIIAGMERDVEELARHNVQEARQLGIEKLVVSCPSCYRTWKWDYPRILGEDLGFLVLHSTQLVLDLILQARIKLGPFEGKVTYHDPCDLGRGSGIFDAPREILASIPGLELVEMAENREMALCCGGGGDVEMADASLTSAVALRRLSQGQETGAGYIVSACQQCKRTLAGAARKADVRIRVMDILELVVQAVGARHLEKSLV